MQFQYIPLSVRVRAWNRSLLTDSEIHSFLQSEVDTIMKSVAEKEKHSDLNTTHTKLFLESMHLSLFNYLDLASKISTGSTKRIVKEMFNQFEIDNLKNIVRMLISGKFKDVFYPYSSTPTLSVSRLLDIRSFAELSTLLHNTIYHTLLPILDQVSQEKNALYWEVALENFYVSRLMHLTHFSGSGDKTSIKNLLLVPIQHLRLVSLYRYRFHYGVEPQEALQYVPNLTNLISFDEWSRFAFAATATEFYQLLLDFNYLSSNKVENHASAIRIDFQQQLEKNCRHHLHSELTSIASFLAFIQLKKIQYQKITTIIESKVLDVKESDILQFL